MNAVPGAATPEHGQIGHNSAPFHEIFNDVNKALGEDLKRLGAPLLARSAELKEKAAKIPATILTKEDHDAAAEVGKEIVKEVKNIEARRVAEKEPTLEAGRKIDGFYNAIKRDLDSEVNKLRKSVGAYLDEERRKEQERRDEEARIARQKEEEARSRADELAKKAATERDLRVAIEAEKLANSASASAAKAAKSAEAKPADMARQRTATGVVSTLAREWVTEITDIDAIDLNKIRSHFSGSDIEKAVRAYFNHDHTRTLDGAKHYETTKAQFK